MGWDEKFYKVVRLEQHPDNCGCYYAWIEIYKDYGGGPVKLAEEYYADVRYYSIGTTECFISPMDSMTHLKDWVDVPVDKKSLRKCITEYFKSIGYKKFSQLKEAH